MARLTALETIRRPVFLLVSLGGLAGTALMPFLLNYTLGDAPRMIRDSSLALLFTGGLLLAAYAAGETLWGEIRRGTAAMALAKPISRRMFLLAKAAGIAWALALHTAASLAATLLAVRAGAVEWHLDWTAAGPSLVVFPLALGAAAIWNRRTRRPFTSAACFLLWAAFGVALAWAACHETPLEHLAFPSNLDWGILGAGGLIYLLLVMAVALATALATRLAVTPVLMGCAGIFCGGLMADSLLGPHLETSFWARAGYALLPNGQVFWLLDALDAAQPIPLAYVLWAVLYAGLWSAACLWLGAWSFQRLEIP